MFYVIFMLKYKKSSNNLINSLKSSILYIYNKVFFMQVINSSDMNMVATQKDLELPMFFKSTQKEVLENDIVSYLDINEQYFVEKNSSTKYRVMLNTDFINITRGNQINNNYISNYFDYSSNNKFYFDIENNFEVKICYKERYEFLKNIDSEKTLYKLYYKEMPCLLDDISSGFQKNIYSQDIFNLINNKLIDINGLSTKINGVNNGKDIYLPITELILFLKPKNNFISTKELVVNDIDISKLSINQSTILGFDDTNYDKGDYRSNMFNDVLFNILSPNGFTVSEFIKCFGDEIIDVFKTNNIKLIESNVILNKEFISHTIGLDKHFTNDLYYSSYDFTKNEYFGGLYCFDKSNFEIYNIIDNKINISYRYNITQDNKPVQIIKDGLGWIEDFKSWVKNIDRNPNFTPTLTYTKYILQPDNNLKIMFNDADSNYWQSIIDYYNSYYNNIKYYPNRLGVFNTYVGCDFTNSNKYIIFKKETNTNDFDINFEYNPYYTIQLKEYSSLLREDTVDNIDLIPNYSVNIDGLYKWRELMDNDISNENGDITVDYPFINNSHYLEDNVSFVFDVDKTKYMSFKMFSSFL